MRSSSLFLACATFFVAATLAAFVGVLSADLIENKTAKETTFLLEADGHDWVVVETDGLLVRVSGVAGSEADRFGALTAVGRTVDASRIIDRMEVVEQTPPAPTFAIEILRNPEGISIIGLVPEAINADHVIGLLRRDGAIVTNFLDTADFPIPPGLETATDFGARAAMRLPRSKISVSADRVSIAAAVDSPEDKARLQSELARLASDSFVLALDIKAPRPVVTPFALRFLRDGGSAQFDICTADTQEARDQIRKVAVRAGLAGKAECTVGLGTPSPRWAAAVEAAIGALAEIGTGSVTFTDADLTLIAAAGTDQATFDRISGELQTALPEAFSLHAVLTPLPQSDNENGEAPTPEFLATLSPEGNIQLRGRVANDLMRDAFEGFAAARFGADKVYVATRPDNDLPHGWPVRVLAGLDALSHLSFGSLVVQPDLVSLSGTTGDKTTRGKIASLLVEKLGDAQNFSLSLRYAEHLDPLAALPTPAECLQRINGVQDKAKISFEPGKATIDGAGLEIIDRLTVAWVDCESIPIEIGGHTDSQGRESMNLTLSQTRAEAVIDGLLARRVLTSSLNAKGYGESTPIADNDTEDGREANRRIEFRLIDEDALTAARRAKLATDTGEEEDEQN